MPPPIDNGNSPFINILWNCSSNRFSCPRSFSCLPEDVKKRQGVSNVLVGDCKLEDVVIHIDQLKIDVALAGPLPPNPNELIGSVSFQKLLEKVQTEYDITFIDTPPVVAVSDTLLIAQPNVSLILVSRLFYLPKPILMHLRNRLLQLNIKLAGLVCNNVDVPKSSYSKYGYGYGYGYGKGSRYSDRKLTAKSNEPNKTDNADNAAPPANKK